MYICICISLGTHLEVVRLGLHDLWRHVIRRADDCLGHLSVARKHSTNTEVAETQRRHLFAHQEYILRLEVPVHDLLGVQQLER